MQNSTTHPAELVEHLERMGLADVLDGYVAPERVRRWGFLKLEQYALEHAYHFDREFGNIYGKLMLVPIPPAPLKPAIIRLITRSDHAAVHGGRRRAA